MSSPEKTIGHKIAQLPTRAGVGGPDRSRHDRPGRKRMTLPTILALFLAALPFSSAAAERERLLVFTKTAAYRHDSIPAAVAAMRKLAGAHGIEVEHSEDAALFIEDRLSRFKAVAFVNTSGNVLGADEQRAFEAFVAKGGGYLGVHAAADTGYDWPWYGELLGAWFKSHPPGLQTGTVRFLRPLGGTSPVAWRVTDEFYDFRNPPPREAAVVALLDESTYQGGGMGAHHPIAWCRQVQGGRSWYTGLGHRPELYLDEVFLAHLEKGLRYAVSRSDEC
jgi:uncharacterized protein